MGRLRPDEALATAHHRRTEGPEMGTGPESRGASYPYSIVGFRAGAFTTAALFLDLYLELGLVLFL